MSNHRGADLAALLALLALSLIQHPDLVFRGLILADYDAFVYFYPLRQFAADAIAQGRLPLWNPDAFLGTPFLANPQVALFYPLSVLFYVLPVPHAYSASLVVHLFLAGAFFYLFARRTLALGPLASLFGSIAFMGSGFFAGQVGHLNQFSAAPWLPLMVTAFDEAVRRRSLPFVVAGAAVLAVQILAGHPQETYMSLVVVGIFVLARATLGDYTAVAVREEAMGRSYLRGVLLAPLILAVGVALGLGLAAVQLVPTLELMGESVRAGGLEFREAAFGSIPPWLVPTALLPGFRWNIVSSTEWVGYVGVVPLVAALAGLFLSARRSVVPSALVAVLGFVLAMGAALPLYELFFDHVPWFDRFRVPARWLFVYIFGVASLAALGVDWAASRRWSVFSRQRSWGRLGRAALVAAILFLGLVWAPQFAEPVSRRLVAAWVALAVAALLMLALMRTGSKPKALAPGLLLAVTAVELWAAPIDLPFRYAVPSDVYAMERESHAFLRSAPEGRVVSAATEAYEVKETPDYQQDLSWLHPRAVLNYLSAVKHNEILTPNLPMIYGFPTADGYDGGVLPVRRFVEVSSVLIAPERVRSDGVWRSRLEYVPPSRLLDLFGIRYGIASNIRDAMVDGIPYDRAVALSLGPGERTSIGVLPDIQPNAVGVVTTYVGDALPLGTPVGALVLVGEDGGRREIPIRLGHETWHEHRPDTRPGDGPRVLDRWDAGERWDYEFQKGFLPLRPTEVVVEKAAGAGWLEVKAITLIDHDGRRSEPLVLDDRLTRETFFDVKVYELRDALPRAWVVHGATVLNDEDALARLRDSGFDPRRQVILAPGPERQELQAGPVVEALPADVERPVPERIVARVAASAPGYLVVTESYDSGWVAYVDGEPASLLRANVAFQAVPLPGGEHVVELRYEPGSLSIGVFGSAASVLAAAVLLFVGIRNSRRP